MAIEKRVSDHQRQAKEPNETVAILLVNLKCTLSLLETLPMAYKQMRSAVVELQRLFLELQAVLDWQEKWKPALDGIQEPPTSFPTVVGTIVQNPRLAEVMFRVGISVWLIWNTRDLWKVRIDSRVEARVAPEVLKTGPLPRGQPVFTGSFADPVKHAAIRGAYSSYVSLENPFFVSKSSLPVSSLPLRPIPQPPKESRRNRKKQRHDPCTCKTVALSFTQCCRYT